MATITKIKLLDQKLNLVYRKKTKQQPAELFIRMAEQVKQLPEYDDVVRCLSVIREGIESNLGALERTFTATDGTITVRSEKNSGPAEKKISGLWRKTTAALAIQILWMTKQRSGVAVNMTLREWENRVHQDNKIVVTVAHHKTGKKEPATLVFDEQMEKWLDRYYNLRRSTGYDRPNFFVTNRGEKIVKIYDDVTRIFGQKLTASVFSKMVETSGRDHDAVTSGAIAEALQHSDRTAKQYYRLPDASEALRRNQQIETVDHTVLVKSYVDKNFEDLFPLEPYIKFDAEEWRALIRDCQAFEEYPSATIDLFYVEKLGDRFDGAVYIRRAEILAEEMTKEKYTKNNYSEHAVIDLAKMRKISYFLKKHKIPKEDTY
ncbi:unnamed protein product [Macrosiphum euphorbiae]|uniref:Uncharacterized protein n=1 Tax=Macrosiphum euphorbiae TaxID=13131 RepID=A0AAV0WBE1_9HEMI|nr:unnamed protein product [Macrosiphum euphorbiae]